jgi:1-acyl-sn-glycerol-3-phosphate acyltransferase
MRKFLGYLFTPLHYLVFGLILVVFEVFQRVALALGGYAWHKRTVDIMNFCLTKSLWFIGSNCRWINVQQLPTDRPLIVVSNHQSLYDIAPFFWYLRRHHMKFVSKIELRKGFPSVSYNLRHGGSVLIDRKDPRQAISALKTFGEYIEANNYAACIFPEGTRSRDGRPKRFASQGLKTLLKYTPSALVVPVTVNNVWRINQYGNFPLSFGESPTWTVHPPIDPRGKDAETVISETETAIVSAIL